MKINTLLPATQGPQPEYARRSFEGIVGTGGDEQGSGTQYRRSEKPCQTLPNKHPGTPAWIPSIVNLFAIELEGETTYIRVCARRVSEKTMNLACAEISRRVRFESRYSIIACPYAVRTRLVGGRAHHHLLIRDFLSHWRVRCVHPEIQS